VSDADMRVAPGGRARTLEEFERLFAGAGLTLAGSTPTASGSHVIQATAA
jgi:hypothetical protein